MVCEAGGGSRAPRAGAGPWRTPWLPRGHLRRHPKVLAGREPPGRGEAPFPACEAPGCRGEGDSGGEGGASRGPVPPQVRTCRYARRARPTGFARRVRGEARAPQRHTGGPGRAASTHRLMERRCLPRHRGRPGEGPREGRRGRDTRGARERALPGAASVRPKAGPPLRPRPRARGQRGAGAQVPRPPGLAPREPPGLRADSAAPAPGRDTPASPTSGNTRQPPRGPSSTVRHSPHPKTGTWGGRSPRSSPVSAPTAGEAVNCAR